MLAAVQVAADAPEGSVILTVACMFFLSPKFDQTQKPYEGPHMCI